MRTPSYNVEVRCLQVYFILTRPQNYFILNQLLFLCHKPGRGLSIGGRRIREPEILIFTRGIVHIYIALLSKLTPSACPIVNLRQLPAAPFINTYLSMHRQSYEPARAGSQHFLPKTLICIEIFLHPDFLERNLVLPSVRKNDRGRNIAPTVFVRLDPFSVSQPHCKAICRGVSSAIDSLDGVSLH